VILILGGTSETRPVARALADAGHRLLISTATNLPLELPDHGRIEQRAGGLDAEQLAELVRERNVRLIVDLTHPYAAEVTRNAVAAADATGVSYLRYDRPPAIEPAEDVLFADDHGEADRLACRPEEPVLLTIGTRNVAPYAEEARRREVELFARILPAESSIRSCAEGGIGPGHQIRARGPFSVEENRHHLRRHGIGVLVTKDSGRLGGTPEKLRAARAESCGTVAVRRPETPVPDASSSVEELVRRVEQSLSP
jgi:precorrin-6A/cobalt-precorrin-6A reductase